MRDNEYNQNMTTEYSVRQEEYSLAKMEFIYDAVKEYGAGAKELEFPEEYGASAGSTPEENAKKRRSFRKRMLKMFTAAAASVILVVSADSIKSSPVSKPVKEVHNDITATPLLQEPVSNRGSTDQYNGMLDKLLLLAEQEKYDDFDEILRSPEMEECIYFFADEDFWCADDCCGDPVVSFIYDGEYARDSWSHEHKEKEAQVLEFYISPEGANYNYSVRYAPDCGDWNAHIEQQGSFKEVVYDLSVSYEDYPNYLDYYVRSEVRTGSNKGESFYSLVKDLNYNDIKTKTKCIRSESVFCESWDNGPRGTCIWKVEHEEEGYGMIFSEELIAEFDDEGVLIPEQCITKAMTDYADDESEGMRHKEEYTTVLTEITDAEDYESEKQRITELFRNKF